MCLMKNESRFFIQALPREHTNGHVFVLVDREAELVDDSGDSLFFSFRYEADILCSFLNGLWGEVLRLRGNSMVIDAEFNE